MAWLINHSASYFLTKWVVFQIAYLRLFITQLTSQVPCLSKPLLYRQFFSVLNFGSGISRAHFLKSSFARWTTEQVRSFNRGEPHLVTNTLKTVDSIPFPTIMNCLMAVAATSHQSSWTHSTISLEGEIFGLRSISWKYLYSCCVTECDGVPRG